MRYRPDIDGLRAVAVLAVVVYHALPTVLRGGFVGVDVFFVISGYLISGHIFAELEAGRFTFTAFYGRRIRRIFPALCLVLLATLAYGFVVLLPVELAQLGADVAGGAGFISNLMLWNEAGYFDRSAIYKPLLHLWSLGIEEQYYIVWPVALWLLYKTRLSRFGFVMAVAIGSFALNAVMVTGHATADFYSPVTRFWELSAGALLAWWQPATSAGTDHGRLRNGTSFIGLMLILVSTAVFNQDLHFPGWLALAPVVGSVLLIAAGPSALINRSLLSRGAAVFIGKISYPLYLWHWPLISYAYFLDRGRQLKTFPALCIFLASVFLAWVTYRLIEQPLRFGRHRRGKTIALAACMLATGGIGMGVWAEHGFPGRFHDLSQSSIAKINAAVGDGIFKPTPHMRVTYVDGITVAKIGEGSPILFTGDSVIYHFGPRVEELYIEGRLHHTVYFVVGQSCAPFPGVVKTGFFAKCINMPGIAAQIIAKEAIGTVVLGGGWQNYFGGTATERAIRYASLEREVADLRAKGRTVYLIMPLPESQHFDPKQMVHLSFTGFIVNPTMSAGVPVAGLKVESTRQRLAAIAQSTGAHTLDALPDICGTGPVCSAFFGDDEPKFADPLHLRPVFVRSHITFLDPILTK